MILGILLAVAVVVVGVILFADRDRPKPQPQPQPQPARCTAAQRVVATKIVENDMATLTVSFDTVAGGENYELQYRKVGDSVWNYVQSFTSPFTVSGLVNGDYEGFVYTWCDAHGSWKSSGTPWSVTAVPGTTYDLVISKDVQEDVIGVTVQDDTNGGSPAYYESTGADLLTLSIPNVFTSGNSYTVSVSLTPSGRASAPIGIIVDGVEANSCPTGCVSLSASSIVVTQTGVEVHVAA